MSPTTPDGDRLADCMHRHDGEAPDGAALVGRLDRALAEHPGSGRTGPRAPAVRAAPLAALAVVAVVVIGLAIGRGGRPTDPTPLMTTPTSSRPTSTPPASTGAALDALTMRLSVGRPRRDGSVPARIHVTNRSGRPVTDPGCRVAANLSFGVIPVDHPRAPLRWGAITDCAGPRVLPPGYDETFGGLVLSVRGLPPGDYLAAVDFGDARSERLLAPVRVTAAAQK